MAGKPSLLDRVLEPPQAPAGAPAADAVDALLEQVLAPPPPTPPSVGERLLMGAMDPVQGGAQLLTHALPSGVVGAVNDATAWVNRQPVIGPVTRALGMVPATAEQLDQQTQAREQAYQARRQAGGQTGTDWARIGGQVAGNLPLAMAAPAGTLARAAVGGAASGALSGALDPVTEAGDYWQQKGKQAATGAALGAVTGPAAHMLGRTIAPRMDENVRTLRQAGVELTPGQVLGGAARTLEDKATSLPLAGDAILGAQRRSLESFNRAVANRVLEPLGEQVPRNAPVGRDLVGTVEQSIQRAYDQAIARARPFGPDRQFAADIAAAGQRFLTPQARQTFIATLRDRVVSRLGQGPIDGATFKTVDSELGAMARPYLSAASPAERELGQAVLEVRRVFRDLLARQNPQAAPLMRRADEAFARFVRMQGAAGMQGATEGVFSPQQLSAAVRSADRSVRHGAYARGDALLQDLSDAGRAVLPSRVPDSGTAGRLIANSAALGGAGMGGLLPHLAGTAATAGAIYSRPGTAILRSLLARDPSAPVGALGDLLARSGGAVAVPLGGLLLSPPSQDGLLETGQFMLPPAVAPLLPQRPDQAR